MSMASSVTQVMALQEVGASIDRATLALDAGAAKTLEALTAEAVGNDRDIDRCGSCEGRPSVQPPSHSPKFLPKQLAGSHSIVLPIFTVGCVQARPRQRATLIYTLDLRSVQSITKVKNILRLHT